jgi:hypothetical protein
VVVTEQDVREMLAWENSGFWLAAVRFGARDSARLELLDAERVVDRSTKVQRDGANTALTLTPLEPIDHLAALVQPPRRPRHRYHGVLAPTSPPRAAATAVGRDAADDPSTSAELAATPAAPVLRVRAPARYL